ncbi:hydrolase [Thermogymnomonas acidicola]|uniref:Hydrolase n=1 Tax=Thermogymnomonas acidicola TaxID=399579 RepID=A0AA37BRY6_9ARCH|nr:hydrolase [Thermogymnomonas acidicola]GGM76410.1 hydrolase [Thermogymnomonas acidicola]
MALEVDRKRTALVLIDLQKGIAAMQTKPYSAKDVIRNAASLADAFRRAGMPVFLVHVVAPPEVALRPKTDAQLGGTGQVPRDWAEFVPELNRSEKDIEIVKRQWGAFYGTELELQMRRRGIDTFVLGGIATSYGVESTARFGYEYGFQIIFAEDAMSDVSEESHRVAVEYIFRRMGLVRKTSEILEALR